MAKKRTPKRPKIGLTMSYGMGWNDCSSEHWYDYLPGHNFVIGVVRIILGCVVFSTKYATCPKRKDIKLDENDDSVTDLTKSLDESGE